MKYTFETGGETDFFSNYADTIINSNVDNEQTVDEQQAPPAEEESEYIKNLRSYDQEQEANSINEDVNDRLSKIEQSLEQQMQHFQQKQAEIDWFSDFDNQEELSQMYDTRNSTKPYVMNFKPSIQNTASGFINKTNENVFNFGKLANKQGLIIHHTGGHGDAEGVINTFKQRKFPAQYIIDRNGQIVQYLPDGAKGQHIRNGRGVGQGLNNSNTEGVEIIAKNDADVLPIQMQAALQLAKRLGYTPEKIYGHGEVNPGHKEATEGQSAKKYIISNYGQKN